MTTLDDVIRVIESQRGRHTGVGNLFYWDPVNGDNGNDGLSLANAKKTWNGAGGIDSVIVDNNHDIVLIHPGEPNGFTTITEQIAITKAYTFLRGTGRDIRFKPTATTGTTISIEAEGVELSGVRVETAATGDGEAVESSGDYSLIHNVFIELSQGDALRLVNVNNSRIEDCILCNSVNGLVFRGITQDCKFNEVINTRIIINSGNGVVFEGANCQFNFIRNGTGTIADNGGWGVLEQANANFNHIIGPSLLFANNVNGDISLIGSGSSFENIGDIANNTWDAQTEDGLTFRQLFKIMVGVLFGKSSGGGTTNIKFRDLGDTKDRVNATVTPQGNRTDVTLDGS